MDTAYTHIWSKTGMVSSEVKAKAVVVTPCTVWPAAVTDGKSQPRTAMTTPPRPQPTSMRL
ncbi:unknown [Bifidobacterium adolescentis CAG:119]|nr:unknown [Bifidobacterium adolescentis CAG:119]